MDGIARRKQYARDHGLDLLYADFIGGHYETWFYSEGLKFRCKSFYTLEGLQQFAKRRQFAIIYLDN